MPNGSPREKWPHLRTSVRKLPISTSDTRAAGRSVPGTFAKAKRDWFPVSGFHSSIQSKTRSHPEKRTSQFSPDQDVVGLVAAGVVIFATRLENVCSDKFCLSGSLRNFISEESHESRGKSPSSRRRKHNSPSTNTTTLPSCHPSIAVIFSCFFAGVCS